MSELDVAQLRVLDALTALRVRLQSATRPPWSSPDARVNIYRYLNDIENAVLAQANADEVAQARDYLGLMRNLDMAYGADFEDAAAKVDAAWETWYPTAHPQPQT